MFGPISIRFLTGPFGLRKEIKLRKEIMFDTFAHINQNDPTSRLTRETIKLERHPF